MHITYNSFLSGFFSVMTNLFNWTIPNIKGSVDTGKNWKNIIKLSQNLRYIKKFLLPVTEPIELQPFYEKAWPKPLRRFITPTTPTSRFRSSLFWKGLWSNFFWKSLWSSAFLNTFFEKNCNSGSGKQLGFRMARNVLRCSLKIYRPVIGTYPWLKSQFGRV